MTTTTLIKTLGTVLLANTTQASAAVTISSAIDVSTKMALQYYIKLGRTVGTALTNEVLFRIEASAKSSGNDEWFPLYQFTSATGKTACNSSTVNDAAFAAGDTSFVIASATGITAGDMLYLHETGVPGDSEWVRIASVSGTTITLEEAVTRAHTNGIQVADLAETFTGYIDCGTIGRIRLIVDTATAASGQTVDVQAWATTLDSATTA